MWSIVFNMVDVPIARPFVPANASAPIEPDVRATTRNFDGRIYILVMDDLHTYVTRTNNVREIAKRFIDGASRHPVRIPIAVRRIESVTDDHSAIRIEARPEQVTSCPKCGPGVFLAKHKDRTSCGKCGYTVMAKKQ